MNRVHLWCIRWEGTIIAERRNRTMQPSFMLAKLIIKSGYLVILGSQQLDVRLIRQDTLRTTGQAFKPSSTGIQDINQDSYPDLLLRFDSIPLIHQIIEIKGILHDGRPFVAKSAPLEQSQTAGINPRGSLQPRHKGG